MKTIHKYDVPIQDEWTVPLPKDAKVLHVGADPITGAPRVWIELDPAAPASLVCFATVPTGGEVPGRGYEHAGTVICGTLVWHVYHRPCR